jgi:transcriptional regulator PpsR
MQALGGYDLDPGSAGRLVCAASDIAVILDRDGVVLDVVVSDAELAAAMEHDWRGRPWIETVTDESRPKIRELLLEAARDSEPAWRQVNHPTSTDRADRPIRYFALKMAGQDRYLALGRDLNAIAELQQRLITAQETTERDYWRVRQAESRFKLLFQITTDLVLVVDAGSQRVLEANPTAQAELGLERAPGNARLLSQFESVDVPVVQDVLGRAQTSGHAMLDGVRLKTSARRWHLSVSVLRHGNSGIFILRMADPAATDASRDPDTARLRALIRNAPDAVVITDAAGHILSHNPAFASLAGFASDSQGIGALLSGWLGRSAVDLNVLIANLRKNGVVRLFPTSLTSNQGIATDVEVSAVALPEDGELCCGFVMRSVAQRLSEPTQGGMVGGRSMEHLTELVGSLPLKELVRESAELIERLSIEAALKLTNDNRAAAAEMLGLSRQSLYVKLRRYGLGEPGDD